MAEAALTPVIGEPNIDEAPVDFATARFAELAKALRRDLDGEIVTKALLNTALSVAFHSGIPVREIDRQLRFYADNAERVFEATSRAGRMGRAN